jgi:Fe-S cluster biogenesis protein NfuA
LFETKGVKSVFFGKDFITITKTTDEVWHRFKPILYSAILDFYAKGVPIININNNPEVKDTTILPDDSEIVATIKELLEHKIRPNVQDDGGDILYEGFDEDTGIVKVSLAGSCVGCPSSKVTLKNGVENMLKHYIPEVKGVEEVDRIVENQEDSSSHVHSTDCKH